MYITKNDALYVSVQNKITTKSTTKRGMREKERERREGERGEAVL